MTIKELIKRLEEETNQEAKFLFLHRASEHPDDHFTYELSDFLNGEEPNSIYIEITEVEEK